MTVIAALDRFGPIDLAEMDRVALQVRMDTKYVFPTGLLPQVLATLLPDYRVLEVGGQRSIPYRTVYFDDPGRSRYFDHHNGRTFRSKVRCRQYVGSGACFLEVKRKTGRGGTDKLRMPVAALLEALTPAQRMFVEASGGGTGPLAPMLRNAFVRSTFVHHDRDERLTIDRGIEFTDASGRLSLDGLCVAELKEARTGHGSPFTALMRSIPVPPVNMSKYCVGTALLHPGMKHNTFKPTLLRMQRARAAA